jgi:UDP-N-acetylglucosamine 2-epimerase (non-hydrolysing)
MADPKKILVVYGTRPEAIKLAPVVRALQAAPGLLPIIAVTGQHRLMLDQVNALFGITPQYDLDLLRDRPSLAGIAAGVLDGIAPILQDEAPDLVVVQGDTTTVLAAALAAFYERVPVAHVEAGLRTNDRYNPFPEEMNRRVTTTLASLHLAPTATSRANLLAEGVDAASVYVTGNTVIDALLEIVDRPRAAWSGILAPLATAERVVLVTAHRRENWGAPMADIGRAIAELSALFPGTVFVIPAHLNPAVRAVLLPPMQGCANVLVTDPLDYADLARVLEASAFVITDSGGIQEEAPSLGKPVLVLRQTTERPEAVTAGTVKLVGTDSARIVAEATRLLTDGEAYAAMARAVNPYGDGRAAERTVAAIGCYFGLNERPEEFLPARAETAPD